jgi:VWFA-related protein
LAGEGYGLNVWISKLDIDSNCNVTLEVTVTDPGTGNFVTLSQDDFTLTYASLPVTDINSFSNTTTVPVSTVLAIDRSNSELGVIGNIRTSANSFIGLLTEAGDEAGACIFDGEVALLPNLTGLYPSAEFATLTGGINSFLPDGLLEEDVVGGTLLYDALYASVDKASGAATGNKPAVIVLSDGVHYATDTTSYYTLDDVITKATTDGVPIFSIYYFDPGYKVDEGYTGNTLVMQRLAEDTGGQYYYGLNGTDLIDIYTNISTVLSNKTTITFTAPTCTGTLTLVVDATYNGAHGQASQTVTRP